MATSETKENICPVCLEAPAVRKVDTCEHSYCENCLSPPNFSCPQCVTARTKGQIADHGGDGKEALQSGTGSQKPARGHIKATFVNINCKLCHFKGITVKATRFCKDCHQLPMCGDCSNAHRNNSVTRYHMVAAHQTADETNCKIHDEPLEHFCTTCSLSVCHICISLDHVDHAVKTFNDVIDTELEKVKDTLKTEEDWLNMLKSDEVELQGSKTTAQKMEDVVIKSIEDHAEKCIEEIITSKEALKKQVRRDFVVVQVMEKRLEAMPELQRLSRDAAAAASQLLNEQAELHSTYVEKLVTRKRQLDKFTEDHPAYEEDKAKYQQTFKELRKKAITFYPRSPNCKIGGFKDLYGGPRCYTMGPCVCETCERTFKWPDTTRVVECRQKGTCTCGTCKKVYTWPNETRVVECRQKGTCTCGTCGCEYNRKMLTGNGCCAKISHYSFGRYYNCESQITVGSCFTFP